MSEETRKTITKIRVDGKEYDIDLPEDNIKINALNTKIDNMDMRTDVVDVVGSKAALNAYNPAAKISANDIVKVLKDEDQGNAIAYYRYIPSEGPNGEPTWTWKCEGTLGAYYTVAEMDQTLNGINESITAVAGDLANEVTARQNAINGLDVDAFSLASTSANVVTLKKIKETDGKIADGGADDVSFYDKTGADSAISSAISTAINALDVSDISGFGADKTLSSLSETDGKISAGFQSIQIDESQVSGLTAALSDISSSVSNVSSTVSALDTALSNISNTVSALDTGKQDKLTGYTSYTDVGSATKIPQISTNELGQVKSITEIDIATGVSSVTGSCGIEAADDGAGNITLSTSPGGITIDDSENGHLTTTYAADGITIDDNGGGSEYTFLRFPAPADGGSDATIATLADIPVSSVSANNGLSVDSTTGAVTVSPASGYEIPSTSATAYWNGKADGADYVSKSELNASLEEITLPADYYLHTVSFNASSATPGFYLFAVIRFLNTDNDSYTEQDLYTRFNGDNGNYSKLLSVNGRYLTENVCSNIINFSVTTNSDTQSGFHFLAAPFLYSTNGAVSIAN